MRKMSIKKNKKPKLTNRFHAGIDAGSISLNCVVINEKREIVFEFPYRRHLGKVEEEVSKVLKTINEKFGEEAIQSISFTGNHGKKFSEKLGDWYDEKQSRDVYRSGFITLLVLIPVMLGLYLVIHNDALLIRGDYFWFPSLVFTTLALFSALTLIQYRET